MMMSGGKLRDFSRNVECGGTINMEKGDPEKSHVGIGEVSNNDTNWKDANERPIESWSPNKEVNEDEAHNVQDKEGKQNPNKDINEDEAQNVKDKEGKQSAEPKEGCVSPEEVNKVDFEKRMDADIPELRKGVSGRLKELLSKSTLLKDKIRKSIDEIEDPETQENSEGKLEKESAGVFTEFQKKQDQENYEAQSQKKKEDKKVYSERRITRSQSKKMRSKISSSDSNSSDEYSSNYLYGSVDSEQKIQEIGAKCGIYVGGGRMKGNKKTSLNGKP
ncbi:hypothetical protein L1887_14203 [Cichorium endivia]|nr:hypothetical protein L1887_14203 [Cichorium endivia]